MAMTAEIKLYKVLNYLKQAALSDENASKSQYWQDVQSRADNAVDAICDYDVFIKNLITLIES